MDENESLRLVVSDEELALLTASLKQVQPKSVDRGFKYRHLFLLAAVSVIIIRSLFFPQSLVEVLGSIHGAPHFQAVFQLRALLAAAVMAVYCYSYVKDWYFERVALVIAAMALTALVMDFFYYYAFIEGPLLPITVLVILLRVGVVACLLVNALRDNRAPLMPRTLWS